MKNIKVKNLTKNKIILIGEMHGVQENIEITKAFITAFEEENLPTIIALEWPTELNYDINIFLNNTETIPPWEKWDFIEDKDGRISKEHIELLQWIKNRNTELPDNRKHEIFCFSENYTSWNERDLKMAQNIISKSQNNAGKNILAIMGNLHAQRSELVFDGETHIPLAMHINKNESIIFKCEYICGTFFNHTKQEFNTTKECTKKHDISIEPSSEKGFDYRIIVPHAHAITPLKKDSSHTT